METLIEIFGEGKDLTAVQMSCRAVVVFFIALALIRVSGRRSFGMRMPLDNIISISLGAVLSRAIVGASPFVPVIITCFVIVILHRLLSWVVVKRPTFSKLFEGDKILLYHNGDFINTNMNKALVCKEDVMQGIRKTASTNDLNNIEKIYMERNGEISVIKKPSQ